MMNNILWLATPQRTDELTLFRSEDQMSWVIFGVVFIILLAFDHLVLNRKDDKAMSFKKALLYSSFWLSCAAAFNVYILLTRGKAAAFDWGTGYMLEWMLSVDNLFVFRSVFQIFQTPDSQKHKPLFWGIVGAIVFRCIFFAIEEVMVHSFSYSHLLFGLFLVYTAFKIVGSEDEEMAPQQNPVFLFLTEKLRVVDSYAPDPKFVTRIPVDARTLEPVLPDWNPPILPKSYDTEACGGDPSKGRDIIYMYHATRLLLVVICLELTDVLFAVDSVSAIVAQIPDLFLAYTACVFAMLGLRATFFVLDELVKLFTLLSYGVAAILMFIGLKLLLKPWVTVPPEVVCICVLSTLGLSMIASILYDTYLQSKEVDAFLIKDVDRSLEKDVYGSLGNTLSTNGCAINSAQNAVEDGKVNEKCAA